MTAFLGSNYPSSELVMAALRAMGYGWPDYFDQPIKTAPHDCIDHTEHKIRCQALARAVQPLDCLFTFSPESLMSRFVARLDQGPWSHSAAIDRHGNVNESVPGHGVRCVALDHYLRWPFRLGLYRPAGLCDPQVGLDFLDAQLGKGYAYRKATVAGLLRFLGFTERPRLPNDLALSPDLELVCRV